MTNRERRKSQLRGVSAFSPSQPAEKEAPADAAQPAEKEAPAARSATEKKKLAYYVTAEDNGRIRAAFLAGRDRYGWRSFTDFQLATMMARVEQLEGELNDGRPFDGVPPKAGPLGRPLD